VLSFLYGTSYSFVSIILKHIDEKLFNAIRMISAMIASIVYFGLKSTFEKGYYKGAMDSIKKRDTPVFHSFICGILFLGIPVSLITISQQSIPSVIVTLSQPCIPLFTMIFAHIALSDEKISISKLYNQLVALVGALLTLLPTISPESNSKDFYISHYIMLLVSLILFGIGSVFIKVYLSKSDSVLSCTLSILGAGLYSLVSSMVRMNASELVSSFQKASWSVIFGAIVMGIVFNCVPTFMFLYLIKTLGAVKANLTNFGQIIIGIIAGVYFLDEWKDYQLKDKILNYFGIFLISITLTMDFYNDMKPENDTKKRHDTDNDVLFDEEHLFKSVRGSEEE